MASAEVSKTECTVTIEPIPDMHNKVAETSSFSDTSSIQPLRCYLYHPTRENTALHRAVSCGSKQEKNTTYYENCQEQFSSIAVSGMEYTVKKESFPPA